MAGEYANTPSLRPVAGHDNGPERLRRRAVSVAVVYLNRSLPACVAVVLIASLAFFWLPVLLFVDARALVAGYMGGHLAGTWGRGALAGGIGGTVAFLLFFLGYLALGLLDGSQALFLLLYLVETPVFGAIGGIAGRRA